MIPGERQDEPIASIFERVADQHGGDGKQAEYRQCVHRFSTNKPCVYRKLKLGRNGDEARRVSGVNE
jgi:hypothetical protein